MTNASASRRRRENSWQTSNVRGYDGAAAGRTDGWLTSNADANAENETALPKLRARARDSVRNNAWAKRIIDILVNGLVGTGIKPTLTAAQSAEAYALATKWGREAYPTNAGTLYTLQAMIARSWFESGEVFILRRNRPRAEMPGVPPVQVQVLEADLCPHDRNETLSNGNVIISGVEFNRIGRRVAYHFYKSHPGAAYSVTGGLTAWDTERFAASDVIHLMQELRPGQVRGVPWLSPVMVALWDLGGIAESFRVNIRAASTLVAVVKGGDPDTPPDGIANVRSEENELLTDADGYPVEDLVPGTVAYLADGKEIVFNHPTIASGYKDLIEAGLHEVAAGAGVSFHILNAGDLSTANFSQAKLGLIQQAALISGLRDLLFVPAVLDVLWGWFIDTAILAGMLRNDPALYDVQWSAPVQQSADRKEMAMAAQYELRLGLRSRREIIESDYGRDPDDVDADIALDKKNRTELKIMSDGDPSEVTLGGQFQTASSPASAPATEEPADA